MPEEAYGQRELAARNAPAESAAKEAAAGADAPAGASEAALEPAGRPGAACELDKHHVQVVERLTLRFHLRSRR